MPMPPEIGYQVRFPKTIVGTFQKACWFMPEIMCSSAMALVGIGMATYGLYKYDADRGHNPEFKQLYTIMRPDDPRVKFLKNPVHTSHSSPTAQISC